MTAHNNLAQLILDAIPTPEEFRTYLENLRKWIEAETPEKITANILASISVVDFTHTCTSIEVKRIGDHVASELREQGYGAEADKLLAFLEDDEPAGLVEPPRPDNVASGFGTVTPFPHSIDLAEAEKFLRAIDSTAPAFTWFTADDVRELRGDKLGRRNDPNLRKQFHERFPLTREEFLEKVYQQERPSAFLASFTKFIFQHLKEPYCYKLIYNSFAEFYENNVMKYENFRNLKVHFTGSISFYFSDILRQVASDKGITVKNILEGPIAGLTLYHQKDLN